jgi:hypothetical protein
VPSPTNVELELWSSLVAKSSKRHKSWGFAVIDIPDSLDVAISLIIISVAVAKQFDSVIFKQNSTRASRILAGSISSLIFRVALLVHAHRQPSQP